MSDPDLTSVSAYTPQAAAEVIRSEFDDRYYLATYPDVLFAKVDPVLHYCSFGWQEGRDPRPDFSTKFYLDTNPDVKAAGINPFLHFVVAGREEGTPRSPVWGPFAVLARTLTTPCDHEEGIKLMFQGCTRFDGDRPVFTAPLVVIAFTNRCGSTFLGSLLADTGLFDPFGVEHLNAEEVRLSLEKTPRTHFVDYLTATLEAKHDGRRLYTIKASAGQLAMLYRWNVFRMFPSVYVVHSYRDDLLAQALSFSIASQTGRWISSMEGKPNDPRFDADAVAFAMQRSAHENTLIFLISRLAGLERCTVLYEHLIAEPETCLRKVCHFCRICFEAATMPQPRLRKQADHVNDAFARQFCAEMNQQLGLRE